MSSRRRMVLRGRSAILAWRTVSVIAESERLRTEMPSPRWPASARIRLVFPQPGGPWSRTPRLEEGKVFKVLSCQFRVFVELPTTLPFCQHDNISLVVSSLLLRSLEREIIFSILFPEFIISFASSESFKSVQKVQIYITSAEIKQEVIFEGDGEEGRYLCGIPRCLYQAPEVRNLWQSFTRLSTRPASITTESRGRDTWIVTPCHWLKEC